MNPLAPDFEPRLSTLQSEMERLRNVTGGGASPIEERLARLTEECAEILQRWTSTSERHARAVERFESHLTEWSEAGTRLQQDASHRIQELERIIHQEWGELRHLHEEPVRQLAEHATSLTQVCIATANVAQQGFERSEARLAAIEGELNQRLTEVTRELQSVVTELRVSRGAQPALGDGSTPWPLEGVTRLHDKLRQGDAPAARAGALAEAAPRAPEAPAPAGLLPEAASALTERIATLERSWSERDATRAATVQEERQTVRFWRFAAITMAVLVLIAIVFTMSLSNDVTAATEQARQAQRAQEAAVQTASRQVADAREEAARQTAEARDRADRAQIIGNVLAAPDLVRYNLVGRGLLTGASAQVHWSRSRGLVFSGSDIAPPPPNTTYQVWLLIRGGAMSAATFTPDKSGAVTVAVMPPPAPRVVLGAIVTMEMGSGSQAPSGSALLARAPIAPPVEVQ